MTTNTVSIDTSLLNYASDVEQINLIKIYINNILVDTKFTSDDIVSLTDLVSYIQGRINIIDKKLLANGRIVSESLAEKNNNEDDLSISPANVAAQTTKNMITPSMDPNNVSTGIPGENVVDRLINVSKVQSTFSPVLSTISKENANHNTIIKFHNSRYVEALYTQRRLMNDRTDFQNAADLIQNLINLVPRS